MSVILYKEIKKHGVKWKLLKEINEEEERIKARIEEISKNLYGDEYLNHYGPYPDKTINKNNNL